jgi:hypothetical protein
MYYILWYESFSKKEAGCLPRPSNMDNEGFNRGVLIPNPPNKISFLMTKKVKGELGDYVLTGLPGLLISEKFKLILEKCGADNVQYIPVEIIDEVTQSKYTNYHMANLIGLVDCLDKAKSKLTMRTGLPDKIRSINELHLDETKIKGLSMFRLSNYMVLIVVSESLKQKIDIEKLRGVTFLPAEGFSL